MKTLSELRGAGGEYLRPHLEATARAMLVSVAASAALAVSAWLVSRTIPQSEHGFFLRAIAASVSAWTIAMPLLYALVWHPFRQQRRARTLTSRMAAARTLMALPQRMAGVIVVGHAAVFTGAVYATQGRLQDQWLLFFGLATAAPSALTVWMLSRGASVRALRLYAPLDGPHARELRPRLAVELGVWAGLALAPLLPATALLVTLSGATLTPSLIVLALVAPAAAALVYRYGRAVERDIARARACVADMQDTLQPLATPAMTSPAVETHEGTQMLHALALLMDTHRRLLTEERDVRTSIAEAQRLKTRFMAYMSHDLRSPLNAILGFSEMLETGADRLNFDQRESLDIVRHAADDLLRLVTQVLDTARLEAGKLRFVSGYVPVATLISGVVGGARRTIETLGIELDTRVEPGVPPVFVDSARVQQALLGLVLHFAHTSAAGSPISLRAGRAKGPPGPEAQVRIFVDAPGMEPPSDPAQLFEAFRFNRRDSRVHSGGLGLGLSLARALVEAQRGTIWFEPPATVCVALPRDGH